MRWIQLLLALGAIGAAQAAASAAAPLPAAREGDGTSPAITEARRVAQRIDDFIVARQVREGVKAGPLADDAAFLRRASLDLNGRPPTVNDARKFLSDRSPVKRERAIEALLDNPGYVNHFTNIWLSLLMPEAAADFQKRYVMPPMYLWLRKHFAENTPYDKMVHELVALQINNRPNQMQQPFFYGGGGQQASPMPFYQVKQGKPEDIAASISRIFLGVRLECAQCHDHPFGKWKRDEFWSQAAFFGGIRGQGGDFPGPVSEVNDRRELAIPNTDRVAQARFLDGKVPRWRFKVTARSTLADWMTAKDNPFLAPAIVNRTWAHFFGIGLVEPIDDLVDDNVPSHPELLTFLAQQFVEHDFDLKFLIRAITLSRTYQLSSVFDPTSPADQRLYTRMPIKGLTSEQLYESLRQAAGIRDNIPPMQRLVNFFGNNPRQTFTDKFTDQEKRTEYHTSIPQALTMMNNQLIIEATHPDRGEALGAVVSSSFMSTTGKIEALYLSALSRRPRPEEVEKLLRYVERGGSADQKKALADVFWALLNSTEFKFNH